MARYLVDTNVLLRAAAPASSHYAAAVQAMTRLLSRGEELLLVPQVLVEFWAVATRPLEANGYGWSAHVAESKVADLLRQFPLLPETPASFPEWLRLVGRHGILGKRVHDARLVALLNIHGVTRLLTFNVGDFRPYGIIVVSPEQVE
jgi:predicted nucleic acid-binding protein